MCQASGCDTPYHHSVHGSCFEAAHLPLASEICIEGLSAHSCSDLNILLIRYRCSPRN